MIACVDVDYRANGARAAAVAFADWRDAHALTTCVAPIADVAPYEPGAFYKRELPCLLTVLRALPSIPDVVVVDGHVWLDHGKAGLGARLLEAEPRIRTVVGVAKTLFRGSPATPVLRGRSKIPLWVDEAGAFVDAPARVLGMHGPHRVPSLLREVDALCRSAA